LVARVLNLERIRAGAFRGEGKRRFSLTGCSHRAASNRSVGIKKKKVDLTLVPKRDVEIVTVFQGN
jgi:hypothetical protein